MDLTTTNRIPSTTQLAFAAAARQPTPTANTTVGCEMPDMSKLRLPPPGSYGSPTPPEHSSQIRNTIAALQGGGKCLLNADRMAGHATQRSDRYIPVQASACANGHHVIGDLSQLSTSLAYMKKELEAGRAVVIGVNRVGDLRTPNAVFGDRQTNHFITAYRLDVTPAGDVRIHYSDPGTRHAHLATGELHLNRSTLIFEGETRFASVRTGKPSTYELTRVRALATH